MKFRLCRLYVYGQ